MSALSRLLNSILIWGYTFQDKQKNCKPVVSLLNQAYLNTERTYRGNELVPGDVDYVKFPPVKRSGKENSNHFYYISYKWSEDEFSAIDRTVTAIEKNTLLDRIGSPKGYYLCPLFNGDQPFSVYQRAIPYLFAERDIEKEPAYHKYVVTHKITREILIERVKGLNDNRIKSKRLYLNILENNASCFDYGEIAAVEAFKNQGIGGGIQYRFVVPVQALLDCELIKEIGRYDR